MASVNKDIYVFRRDRDNVVRRGKHDWYDDDGNPTVVDGHDVLPGFKLQLGEIDEAISQVRLSHCSCHANALIWIGPRNLRSWNRATTKKSLVRNVPKPLTTHTSLLDTLKTSIHVESANKSVNVFCVLTFDFDRSGQFQLGPHLTLALFHYTCSCIDNYCVTSRDPVG
jgi:hypothetical protein